jgi:hypothetical protein
MPGKAPRPTWRLWRGGTRGARLMALLWLASAGGTAAQEAVTAHYEGPVTRYPHGVLGDKIEYDTLAVTLSDGRTLRRRWAAPLVFEDIAPRLWDVDGDGAPEVVTVESHEQRGARLAIWAVRDGTLDRLVSTPFIGQRFRWLAPVGAADLDGDGAIEIAYVDRPHLARVLRIWRFADDNLTEVARAEAVSNHRIGWDYIIGGIRDCGTGPEMVVASGDWQDIVAVRYDGMAKRSEIGPYSPSALARAMDCN